MGIKEWWQTCWSCFNLLVCLQIFALFPESYYSPLQSCQNHETYFVFKVYVKWHKTSTCDSRSSAIELDIYVSTKYS